MPSDELSARMLEQQKQIKALEQQISMLCARMSQVPSSCVSPAPVAHDKPNNNNVPVAKAEARDAAVNTSLFIPIETSTNANNSLATIQVGQALPSQTLWPHAVLILTRLFLPPPYPPPT